MANSASSRKRSIQSEKRRQRNASLRSSFRTALKKVRVAIGSGNADEALLVFNSAASVIDKICSKGIIHPNRASRCKSRLIHRIKSLGVASS
ncbi:MULTISPECIES: 30S ribosomal protein S20 [Candidatus Ichthyocystis]|uniref:Small ribosomal subunit protein bS20 n=1 Tax=Candidatus Ichthyocystis hellenicum TaxID=1561003 RepID=A0A0S4M329_9BURK|nr:MULTISPECIES: 30S ribosomal protein S20 [Ichthyocystis]CUT18183.1 30S ribosomal protein S20 [Candidatus Ichthyocystis hellenicum]